MTAYHDAFERLRHVLLEDSWVLAIRPDEGLLTFDLEVVLTPEHPDYRRPVRGEHHDYRRAQLSIRGNVKCAVSGALPSTDASGSTDLGHIDVWSVDETGLSRLEGDWGRAEVQSADCVLAFE